MSTPATRMRPAWGATTPVRTFTSVVLPAPLGPMSPVTAPAVTEMETPSTARTPPKWRTTSVATTSGSAIVRYQLRRVVCRPSRRLPPDRQSADDPVRAEDDHGDEQSAVEHVPVGGRRPDHFGEGGEHDRPHQRTGDGGHAPDDGQHQHKDGPVEGVLGGIDEEVQVGVESARPG